MFKINIAEKTGKTYKLEAEAEEIIEKSLHDTILGKELLPELDGYEFEITGASDKSGFTAMEGVEGIGLKRVLLKYGKAMHKRPRREGKKKVSNPKPKGLRMRKTVRGQIISPEIIQINLKILKEGAKKLSEIFPEQNKAPEPEVKEEEVAPKETPTKTPVEKAPEQEAPKETNVSIKKKATRVPKKVKAQKHSKVQQNKAKVKNQMFEKLVDDTVKLKKQKKI